jgi:hypothetical protein
MKQYNYFFHVQTYYNNEPYDYSGIYQSEIKIIGGNTFTRLLDFIINTMETPHTLTYNNIILRSLSFLHEVDI